MRRRPRGLPARGVRRQLGRPLTRRARRSPPPPPSFTPLRWPPRHQVGQYYEGELYRADLLPVPSYLLRCLRAHARAGPQALANFLDASYLGNGTLLREYLLKTLERAGLPRVETGGHAVAHGPDETLADWSAEELEELDRIAHTCRAAARETH